MTESKPKPRVIVVDDEHVIADTLAIILNRAGFNASAVYTGTRPSIWPAPKSPTSSSATSSCRT